MAILAEKNYLVEVLYHRQPTWLIGETWSERDARMESPRATDPLVTYPSTCAGEIISTREVSDITSGKLPTLKNMSDRNKLYVKIDVTESIWTAIKSREKKMDVDTRRPIDFTVDDYLGATRPSVVESFGGDSNAMEIAYGCDGEDNPLWRKFNMAVMTARKALPKTITFTGTGNYYTKQTPAKNDDTQSGVPVGQVITLVTGGLGVNAFIGGYITNITRGETRAIVSHTAGTVTLEGNLANWLDTDDLDIYDAWSSWTANLAQLFTDQGAAQFTTNQYVRGYTGTYTETVQPNSSLNTDDTDMRTLFIEGDPNANRDTIIIQNSGAARVVNLVGDHFVMRHLKVISTGATLRGIDVSNTDSESIIDDVTVVKASGGTDHFPIYLRYGVLRRSSVDATFSNTAYSAVSLAGPGWVQGCQVTTNGIGLGFGNAWTGQIVEGCVIWGCTNGISAPNTRLLMRVVNCTFYDNDYDILGQASGYQPIHIANNIFQGASSATLRFGQRPSETADYCGPRLFMRNNYFFNQTNTLEIIDGGATFTFAQLEAFDLVDASGQVNGVDPQMTDPGSGDFSLQSGSPCENAGIGSGVLYDYLGNAFDENNPDIGGWSSGAVAAVTAPTWAGGTISGVAAADANTDGDLTVSWNAATQAASIAIGYIVEYRTTVGPGAWTEAFRTNATSGRITGLTNTVSYDVRVKTYTRVVTEPTTTGTDTATATPTSSTPTLPTDPTITGGTVSGLDVTVTIAGDAGATYRARLMDGADTEEDEDGRTGPGTITLTALGTGLRYLVAWGVAGVYQTEPTNVYIINIPDTTPSDEAYYRVIDIVQVPGTPFRQLVLERTERPVTP